MDSDGRENAEWERTFVFFWSESANASQKTEAESHLERFFSSPNASRVWLGLLWRRRVFQEIFLLSRIKRLEKCIHEVNNARSWGRWVYKLNLTLRELSEGII